MFFSNTLSFLIGFMKELVAIYSLTENHFEEKRKDFTSTLNPPPPSLCLVFLPSSLEIVESQSSVLIKE